MALKYNELMTFVQLDNMNKFISDLGPLMWKKNYEFLW